jgi:hypothetical protein
MRLERFFWIGLGRSVGGRKEGKKIPPRFPFRAFVIS